MTVDETRGAQTLRVLVSVYDGKGGLEEVVRRAGAVAAIFWIVRFRWFR